MTRLWGGHVSVARGVELAPARGRRAGLRAIQIFTKNQHRWQAPELVDERAERFHRERRAAGIRRVASHGSYLVNLASTDRDVRRRSHAAFVDELDRCARLGVDQLIFHPGAHLGAGESAGLRRVARALGRVIDDARSGEVRLLVETTAGQGSCLGWRFEHLRDLLDACRYRDRMGVCLDTCHVFAAGYDVRAAGGYRKTFDELDRLVGLERLEAFHVNDSKTPLGSRVDRHETLGAGAIGAAFFRRLGRDPRFRDRPFYLETPGGESGYRSNLEVLRGQRRPALSER